MALVPSKAEPGRIYPAWRDGRRKLVVHAVTDRRTGNTYASGFAALCGRPVRFPVVDEFDPDDDDACIECAAIFVVANPDGHH
jgi:hypothetical protein